MPQETRSIGQVLAVVRLEFSEVTISKIRFLEAEGLLSPERAPSGYRKYRDVDVERLRYILRMQRDYYLPLKVIREHLDLMDRGLTPPPIETPQPIVEETQAPEPAPEAVPEDGGELKLTRHELLAKSGLSEAAMVELERQHLLSPRRGSTHYGRDALTIAVVARRLTSYGMDVRHLRAFKQAAEREVGIIEQAIAPHVRRSPNSAVEMTAEAVRLVIYAHASLMRSAMNP